MYRPARGGRSCERFGGYKTLNRIPFPLACQSKLRSIMRSDMHPCPGNKLAIGRAVMYYAWALYMKSYLEVKTYRFITKVHLIMFISGFYLRWLVGLISEYSILLRCLLMYSAFLIIRPTVNVNESVMLQVTRFFFHT